MIDGRIPLLCPRAKPRVDGATHSKHIVGNAFNIAMTNRDPVVVEAAVRAVGFLRFGFYPRSSFMHVDLGQARSWGQPFQVWAAPFASETTPMREVHTESQTLKGAGTAGVEVLADAQGAVLPLVTRLDSLRWIFIVLALAGIGAAIWARIDDWRKGRR